MERVAHGIYLAEDAWPDSLYLLSLKNQEIIFSHETAMYLFGMTDREPTKITVTIHSGYNASHLRKNHIKVYTVNNNVFQLGKTEIKTIFGNPVAAYDPDRSLCDIIKNKSDLEVQIFNTIMNEYMKSPDKNLGNLMKYASILGIDDKVRLYTEVML